MQRRSTFVLVSILVLASCAQAPAGGSDSSPGAASSFPVTFVDDDGISVTLPEAPRRIVTFAPSITEILFALGIGDRIVGVSGPYDDYPVQAASIAQVGGAGEFGVDPNLETVLSLEPDLFLTIAGGDAWKERLRALGVNVVTVDASDIDDLLGDITAIGTLTGTERAASSLVEDMRQRVAEIAEAAASVPRVSCFFEVYYPPLIAAGPGTFIDDLLDRAGCDSVSASAASAYPEWSVEDLVARSPEVYLVSSESAEDPDSVASRPGFEAVAAVAEGKVFLIDSDLVTRAGPRIVEGFAALVEALRSAAG